VIYELHVGTFTPEGTYAGVEKKLDYLRDLGITAIELMPLNDVPGRRNWVMTGCSSTPRTRSMAGRKS
jgi:maltooligosyltrehalose trehalohydrolase